MNRRPLLLFVAAVFVAAWAPRASAQPATAPAGEPAAVLPAPAPQEAFTVAILADRTTGYDSGLAVLERAVDELNLLQPDLVFHIGDLVPGYIRDMDRWQKDIEAVKGILGRLEAPLYPLPGNHDVITGTGNPDDRRGEALYEKHFGPLYYSVDYRGAHFVCLYTDEALQSRPQFSRAQLDWLREDLDAATAEQVFVLMHKPVWEYGEQWWDQVHPLLRDRRVRAVFAGHFHHYYKSELRDGIQYYVIGVTGGRTFSPELAGGLEHYCLLRVRPDGCRLALVKPGGILADDYIALEDFKNMERLRFLSRSEVGLGGPVPSPEGGPAHGEVDVFVLNPLSVAMPVSVRGVPRGGLWRFTPSRTSLILEPGSSRHVYLDVQAPAVATLAQPPEVAIEYTYTDTKGRTVPIVLTRRVPLLRTVHAPPGRPTVALDGRPLEAAWQHAPVLTTAIWEASPYETGQAAPTFRLLTTGAGVYLLAEGRDGHVSSFRGERMLSDALFVGAMPETGAGEGADASVVLIYPFGPEAQAVRAFWDPKRPTGPEVLGVHFASVVDRQAETWHCEAFVPWDALLPEGSAPGQRVRFNVGAWDNDGDLFTELHSWAPTADCTHWGRLVLEPAPVD